MNTNAEFQRDELDKCWNRIGVWSTGKASCPELKRFVHCRNCSHYSAAGRHMLERVVPDDYRREWTERYAQKGQIEEICNHSALLFRLGDEWLAIESRYISEITQVRKIHSLPHRSDKLVKGLVNIRGELKLCISIGTILKLEKARDSHTANHEIRERMILIEHEQQSYIFPVSEVQGTLHYGDQDLQALPATLANAKNNFTRGIFTWNEQHVGILDHELLFYALERGLK
jgi:chemotaxis-related protein WspD